MIKTSALAASDTQDGVKVDLTTDKENYKEDEKIAALLTVTNTNNTPIKNISLEISSLEGYDITDFQKQVEFLKPNESVSLKTKIEANTTAIFTTPAIMGTITPKSNLFIIPKYSKKLTP